MDRFKLEDAIMQCWSTKEDLMLFAKCYCDHPKTMSEDDVMNVVLGIASLHELRCAELFEKYKQVFKLEEWNCLQENE